jgi:formylglycine-generating enzyme required for sulfatase activity
MVLVPGGCFDLGPRDEPMKTITRRVCLRSFFMDRSEVTVAAYGLCVRAGSCSAPKQPPFNKRQAVQQTGQYPVAGLVWRQARDYCRWAGKRLPTYDEWERAARGPKLTMYPWGNSEPTANNVDLVRLDERSLGLRPVCTKPLGNSPEGLCDMVDNAPEYVGTGSTMSSTGALGIRDIATAADEAATGKIVVGRVGTQSPREACEFSLTADESPSGFIGFRCAREAPEGTAGSK